MRSRRINHLTHRMLSLLVALLFGSSLLLALFLIGSSIVSAAPTAVISGNVYRDFNANGADDGANEPGIEGIVIVGTSDTGVTATATSDVNGDYSLTIVASSTVRLEYRRPVSLNFLESGASPIANDGTSEQFVDVSGGTATVNIPFYNPAQYCDSDPTMATSCFVNGDGNNPTGGQPTADFDAIVLVPYNGFQGADAGNRQGNPARPPTAVITTGVVGPVWGMAYDPNFQRLFSSAFVKRHSEIGPGGYGMIYVTNFSGTTPLTTSQYVDLTSLGVTSVGTVTGRDMTGDAATHSYDIDAYDKVGKAALGDIAMSHDGTKLYTVNLDERTVIELDVTNFGSPAVTKQISFAAKDSTCPNGLFRAFALKYHDGQLYLGGVCTAESGGTVADMYASVYQVDLAGAGAIAATPFYSRSLDYTRGAINGSMLDSEWQPWSGANAWLSITPGTPLTVIYPEPLFSDLEFDNDGSLIIGLMDRHGHRVGANNFSITNTDTSLYQTIAGGDLLRACNVAGTLVTEGQPGCPFNPLADPFVAGEEYYTGLNFSGGSHFETFVGGLALLPGSDSVVATAMDPWAFNSGGIFWLNNTDGTSGNNRYELFEGNMPAYLGKANGLGDLELICAAAPLEIGNRVWIDTDRDGVQDPEEAPIAGVVITLYEFDPVSGTYTPVATATTTSSGHYLFNNSNVPGGVKPNTQYVVRIDDMSVITGLGLDEISPADTGGNDFIDNDSVEANTVGATGPNPDRPEITVTTGRAGQNNHTLDFGFSTTPTAVTITDFGATAGSNNNTSLIILGLFLMTLTLGVIGLRLRKSIH